MADLAHPLRRRSLLARVLAGVLALLLVGGIVVALAAFAYGHQAARQTYDRLLLGAANDMAEAISVVGGVPVATIPVAAFELLSFSPDDRVTYAVRGPGGDLLTGHEATRAASGMAGADPYYFDGEMQGEKARFVTVVRRFAERDYSGAVSVTVGQTVAARTAMAQGLTRDALIAAAIAGLALVAVAFVVIRSAMRPLDRIAAGLLARDPYDLTPMETNVPGEVAVMIDAMNRFMRRLDRQIAAMRNLISDTAHQLRTPVAAIRAQAELAAEEEDADLRAQGIERLVRRTRSLGSLLDENDAGRRDGRDPLDLLTGEGRAALATLLGVASNLVRSFPEARELDDEHQQFRRTSVSREMILALLQEALRTEFVDASSTARALAWVRSVANRTTNTPSQKPIDPAPQR